MRPAEAGLSGRVPADLLLEGALGNTIVVASCVSPDDCLRYADLHRRVAYDMVEQHGGELCPDLLEVAELWEQAAQAKIYCLAPTAGQAQAAGDGDTRIGF